jgi:hypothetical protein
LADAGLFASPVRPRFSVEDDAHQDAAPFAAVIISQSFGTELFRGRRLSLGGPPQWGDRIMTEDTHRDALRRNSVLQAALEEMAKFERQESEFRKKDRAERAADLRLPLDEIQVH